MAIMLANPSKYIEERKRLNVKKPAKSKRLSKNAPSKHLTILHQYLKSRYVGFNIRSCMICFIL